jgi:hypothetical protein
VPLDRTPRTEPLYDETGHRLDLAIDWEPAPIVEARWREARTAYLARIKES